MSISRRWQLLMALVLMLGLCAPASALSPRELAQRGIALFGGDARATSITVPGSFAIGSEAHDGVAGTRIAVEKRGTLTYADADDADGTITLQGAQTGDRIVVTPNSAYSEAVYLKSVVAGTDMVTVTWSGDPGTTVSLGYVWWRQED